MNFSTGKNTIPLPVAVKKSYSFGEIADLDIAAISMKTSCRAQVVFTYADDPQSPIDHSMMLPDAALHRVDNPIKVASLTVPIQLADLDDDGSPSGDFILRRMSSDSELTAVSA